MSMPIKKKEGNLGGRILYINHDSFAPADGVRTIYYHVAHLIKNGYPTFAVHNQPDFKPSWYVPDIPILYLTRDFQLFPNDIVVIPEDYLRCRIQRGRGRCEDINKIIL